MKSFSNVVKRSLNDDILETQNHSLEVNVRESAHLNCDMSLIDLNEFNCIEKNNAWECIASCKTQNQRIGRMKKHCRCYTTYLFIEIYDENNCHWKDEECSADNEIENENNHHENESFNDTDNDETTEVNTQTSLDNTENIENENASNNEIEPESIFNENEPSNEVDKEETTEINDEITQNYMNYLGSMEAGSNNNITENNDLQLTYNFLRSLSKWKTLRLEKKDDDLTLVIESGKMQLLSNDVNH